MSDKKPEPIAPDRYKRMTPDQQAKHDAMVRKDLIDRGLVKPQATKILVLDRR